MPKRKGKAPYEKPEVRELEDLVEEDLVELVELVELEELEELVKLLEAHSYNELAARVRSAIAQIWVAQVNAETDRGLREDYE